ncbi:Saccharopine dehydrogenase Homospermidine synthase [Fusarium subglutinans]|uniref:Saccharopine dehydrogenase Homospermidine synthase n=1 Tax=Gibberella subglutinans TaxID=42677 RepID=A0A8H5KK08_GIBSU|nr:Saccharopine dehydrogenase Homospermidine synthase [Fusarium subglutinans]KAF5574667.1 Saccharopine dehydrogenase Homospermidine synthase [Fusarium subglutinans]
MSTRSHEITILGATGWTAAICAEHIAKTFTKNTRWCIAGRSASKLEALRQDLRAINPDRLEPAVYIIPQLDTEGLEPIVRKTKVLINGIGPYHRYGSPVVNACVRNGTHYVDSSTETAWIAETIQNFHETAKNSGAIIIPAISGSSAPSDLVAWLIARHLREQGLPAASKIVCSGKLSMIGMQGGSLHTVLDVAETYGVSGWLTSDTSVLLPNPKHVVKKNKELMSHRYDRYLGHLATSFVAWGNESVVQRSAALNLKIYGQDFVYKEYSPAAGLVSALFMHIVTKLGILLLAVPWFRSFIRGMSFDRGSGPDRDESRKMESAEWKAVGYVTGKKEPVALAEFSYKGALVDMAAILAVEAAASINQLSKTEPTDAGLLTPSTLGMTFVDRLRAAGFDLMVDGLGSH